MSEVDHPAIILRDVTDEDLDHFFAHQRDPVAQRMAAFTARDPEDRAAFDGHWLRLRADPTVTVRTVVAEGVVAGHVASFEQEGRREVTYWIDRDAWGRGLATAALTTLLAEERTRPIYAWVARDNLGSRRVLEKCGFTTCGEDREFARGRECVVEQIIMRRDEP